MKYLPLFVGVFNFSEKKISLSTFTTHVKFMKIFLLWLKLFSVFIVVVGGKKIDFYMPQISVK